MSWEERQYLILQMCLYSTCVLVNVQIWALADRVKVLGFFSKQKIIFWHHFIVIEATSIFIYNKAKSIRFKLLEGRRAGSILMVM